MKKFTLMLLGAMLFMSSFAQTRYLDPVFTKVNKQGPVVYGFNTTILPTAVPGGKPTKQPLVMDVYTPDGDTEKKRPVVLLLHTGNFLPIKTNGGTTGERSDSVMVEMATRFAKMGYVAVSVDYRQGWNPVSKKLNVRINTLINAAYRGVQDVRSCIRFFKKTVDKDNNPFGVDPDKIMVIGQGTGGYISTALATLDNYPEIFAKPTKGKFIDIDSVTGNPIPMVIESINGDVEGKKVGFIPKGSGLPFEGDTLCYPNHPAYTSNFQLGVNLGGALADTSWMKKGDVPMISFHVPNDPFAPYNQAVLIVPTTGDKIVEVMGARVIQQQVNKYGNNAIFNFINRRDPMGDVAKTKNEGLNGLFPVHRPKPAPPSTLGGESGPWEWWDAAFWSTQAHPSCPAGVPLNLCNFHIINSGSNPDMSKAKALRYIDTVTNFVAPRACMALDLPCKNQVSRTKVTFSVDMKGETVDPAKGVCIAGNFQRSAGFASDWTPGITKLVNKPNSTIWEITVEVTVGSYEFKFINDDGWNGKEEKMTGKGCYKGDNREFTVKDLKDMKVGTYAYNQCSLVSANDVALESAVSVFPNPNNGAFTLNYQFEDVINNLKVEVVNTLGQVVFARNIENAFAGSSSFDLTNVTGGVYLVKITDGKKQAVKRVVIQK
jgi:acetyl esterase/lipase